MYPTKSRTGVYWDRRIRLVSGCTPEERLVKLTSKRPSIIAIWNDLFHEKIGITEISKTFAYMAVNPQNLYLVLTKRAERMQDYFYRQDIIRIAAEELSGLDRDDWTDEEHPEPTWTLPLPNVWLGVTAENQKAADERIPQLCATPAAVRFLSVEPLLEGTWLKLGWSYPGTWKKTRGCAINWVILGAETGAGRRPCKEEWVRSLVQQCKDYDVPVWIKALEIDGRITHDINQFPKDLQLRQFPELEVK